MNKVLNKWYFGLVIIPVLVNYLTEVIRLPTLFKNWNYTIIGILAIAVLILSFEVIRMNKVIHQFKSTPKKSDKKIVKELIEILDVDSFHDKIKEQNTWYGYEKEAIRKTFKFSEKAGLIGYRTTDKKLNKIIQDLKEAIDDFNHFCGSNVYPNGSFYALAKDTDFNVEKAEKATPIMNEKADFAFSKLSVLMDYLRSRNFL